ncbi:MAG: YerC/YecD family TrpR-related protein [Lachnospiraceae bacterium]|nr:YerC/YecD family TrpR-related protein [Lachnospiraceae bacterium]
MNRKIKNEMTDGLFQAVLSLENLEECYGFFEDVCTINEIQSIAQRFEVARLLREKKTYLEIAERTGASTATISRVNRSLNYGNDAYDMVFQRMEQKKEP